MVPAGQGLDHQHGVVRRGARLGDVADLLYGVQGRRAGDEPRLGVQFARQGIRVNALCPGPVNTPLLRELFAKDPERAARRLVHVPVGRFAEPEEMAAAVAFLASDDASFITASTFLVDGGIISGLCHTTLGLCRPIRTFGSVDRRVVPAGAGRQRVRGNRGTAAAGDQAGCVGGRASAAGRARTRPRLGVRRDAVREAIHALADAGYVASRRGRYGGTFLTEPLPTRTAAAPG